MKPTLIYFVIIMLAIYWFFSRHITSYVCVDPVTGASAPTLGGCPQGWVRQVAGMQRGPL